MLLSSETPHPQKVKPSRPTRADPGPRAARARARRRRASASRLLSVLCSVKSQNTNRMYRYRCAGWPQFKMSSAANKPNIDTEMTTNFGFRNTCMYLNLIFVKPRCRA